MVKPRVLTILVYFLSKYLAFYVFLMFKNNDFTLVRFSALRGFEDVFFYLWMFLFLPIVCFLVLGAPLYSALRNVRSPVLLLMILSGVVVLEYFMYTYLASQANWVNGIYNGLISVLLLFLFFYKRIKQVVISPRRIGE